MKILWYLFLCRSACIRRGIGHTLQSAAILLGKINYEMLSDLLVGARIGIVLRGNVRHASGILRHPLGIPAPLLAGASILSDIMKISYRNVALVRPTR